MHDKFTLLLFKIGLYYLCVDSPSVIHTYVSGNCYFLCLLKLYNCIVIINLHIISALEYCRIFNVFTTDFRYCCPCLT